MRRDNYSGQAEFIQAKFARRTVYRLCAELSIPYNSIDEKYQLKPIKLAQALERLKRTEALIHQGNINMHIKHHLEGN